jgi:3-deoxy-D-manno-octulosonic-acid transferase
MSRPANEEASAAQAPPPLVHRVGGRLLAGFIGLTYRTSQPPPQWDEHLATFKALHPFILALWHGQFMLLPALPRDDIPTRVMLALHKDAEAMAEALRAFDLELIRGAGAGIKGRDRGGANAFRAASVALAQGYTVAMTADVPPGPARRCGPGIITLAKVSGRPILPVALASSRFVPLNTWSRLTINLPFSQLGGSFGNVVRVPADASSADLERYRQELERQLDIATADAYGRAGADPMRAMPAQAVDRSGPPPPARHALRRYRLATRLVRPLLPALFRYRARRGKEEPAREGERYGIAALPRPAGRLVWVHAASVGETNAVLPLLAALRAARPDLRMLLTTGTVTSARTAAARLPPGDVHQYLPLDAERYVRAFLDHWRPDLGILTESEIWPNLVVAASDRSIPLAIVNARMSKDAFHRWRKRPAMALPLFRRFDVVLAQNKLFALRYEQLGASTVRAIGNLKVDAPPPPVDAAALQLLRAATGMRPVWLAASTHNGEERIVAEAHRAIARQVPGVLTIIAPRHPERGDAIAALLAGFGLAIARRSLGQPLLPGTDIYLADTLNELGTLIALTGLVFMGKSLIPDGGGHNPVEPIRLGAAVLTGPSIHNFIDAYHPLIRDGGVREVATGRLLAEQVGSLLVDAAARDALAARGRTELDKIAGALPQTLTTLLAMLPPAEATRDPARVAPALAELG